MSTAQTLFSALRTEENLRRLVDEEEEGLHLDFKERTSPRPLGQDRELLKTLAKGISAFANADGGVLVLGVRDTPRELAPLAQLAGCERAAHEQQSRLVAPPVPGADLKAIPAADGSDRGYLVFLVPPSDVGPHMSLKHHIYFQRVGESAPPMDHHQLALMFGRPPHPVLGLRAEFTLIEDSCPRLEAVVHLTNAGRGVARYPMVELRRLNSDVSLPSTTPFEPLFRKLLPQLGTRLPRYVSDERVYPASELPCFTVTQTYRSPRDTSSTSEGPALYVDVALYADGAQPRVRRLALSQREFCQVVGRDGPARRVAVCDSDLAR